MKVDHAARPGGIEGLLIVTIKQIGTGGQGSIGGSAASGDKIYTSPAFIGRSQIDFNVVPSTTPPIAGDYAETVTLTFAADT